jgi:hypothetical protein
MPKDDVLARYGNFYRGDDDLFAHCLILRSGHCVTLFQGLTPVTAKTQAAPAAKMRALLALLKRPFPTQWPQASYSGYNFITDAEGPAATEIAVFGGPKPGGYYAAPADSDVGQLVRAIARID